MDRVEQTVRRKEEKDISKDRFIYHLMFAAGIACMIYAAVMFVIASGTVAKGGSLASLLPIIPALICGILCLVFKSHAVKEYDYCVEDDILTVAVIYNLTSRKELLSIPVSSLKRVEPYSKERLANVEKTVNASLNPNKKILFFDSGALIFEPSEEMENALRKIL